MKYPDTGEEIPESLVKAAMICMVAFPKASELMRRYSRGELTYEECTRELVALYPQLSFLLEGLPLQ